MKIILSLATLGLVSATMAQYSTGFEANEGYAGSASGTLATGQNGWYNPVSGSNDASIYTYVSNAIGTVINAQGGDQFMGCLSNTNATAFVCRAQRDIPITASGTWTMTFDWNGQWAGPPPSQDNLGSVSLQPSTTSNQLQTLYHWTDINNPTTITADYGVTDAAGLPSGTAISVFFSAGPEWTNLPVNHWYRSSTTWDWNTNAVISVSIQDLTANGPKTTVFPVGWYLSGGANNIQGRTVPTAIRLFAGGGITGNVMSYDNLSIGPASSTETLAPTAERVLLGTSNSGGNLASWAADDANARTVCKLFVPNSTSPFIRADLDFTTTKTAPTAISFNVKVSTHTPGPQGLTLSMQNKTTNAYVVTSVNNANIVNGTTYSGVPTGTLADYRNGSGLMTGRVEVKQTGPSTSLFPCASFEFGNMVVTG